MAEEVEIQEQEQEKEKVSIDTLSMKDYEAARAKGVTEVDKPEESKPAAESQKSEEKDAEEHKKSGGGFQKRIARLVKHNATLEEELAASKKRTEELETKLGAKPVETKADDDPEPKQDDFDSHEKWLKAQTRWEIRQELKTQAEEEAKQAELEERKALFDVYNLRVAEAHAKYDDFKEVVGQSIDLPAGVGPAIIEMENGPDVAYHLGKHPEICKQLLEMGSLKAIGKVWRLSEELAGEKPEEKNDEKPDEEKPEKPVTKAAAPIKPVGNGATKSSVPLDKLDMRAYNKARDAGRVS